MRWKELVRCSEEGFDAMAGYLIKNGRVENRSVGDETQFFGRWFDGSFERK